MEKSTQIALDNLKEIIAKRHEIGVQWDCGGDQSPCWLIVDNQPLYWYSKEDNAWSREIIQEIIYELGLPNAGECYSKGEGVLSFNEVGKLVLNYRCFDYCETYEPENTTRINPRSYPIAIHKMAQKYLHKIRIVLQGEIYMYRLESDIYREQIGYISVRVNTIHGDSISFKEKQEQFYIEQTKQLLLKVAAENKHLLDQPNMLLEIDIVGTLRKADVVELQVTIEQHKGAIRNKEQVLFS